MHEEDVVDLLARALAECQASQVGFCDPTASEIARALDIDVAHRLDDPAPLRRSLAVTMLVDAIVSRFFDEHPDGLAIGFHQGLCTRFSRIDNGRLRWIDVDLPAVAEMKRALLPACARRSITDCASERCTCWLETLGVAEDVPTIIVAQRSLCRADAATAVLLAASRFLSARTEVVLDYDVRLPLRRSATRTNACLEIPLPDGSIERFPRLRFVPLDEYPIDLAHDMRGLNGVSRLFRGRSVRSVAHLRFI